MWYDIVTVAILGFATFRGAARGIVWQLAAIGALLLCFAFAGTLSLALAPALPVEPPLNRWVAMFLIYIGFSFVAFGAARWLRDWIEKARFVEFDRHLGAVFGFLKGATFCLVLTFFVVTLSESLRSQVLHSWSGYAAAVVMDRLHPVMPTELHDVLEPYIHNLDRPGMDLHHSPHHHGTAPHQHADQPLPPWADPGRAAEPAPAPVPKPFPADEPETSPDVGQVFNLPEPITPGLAAEILRDISMAYSDSPHAQELFAEEVEAALYGLPDPVAVAVLKDWRFDLLAFGADDDPDPRTDFLTPLEVRVRRQLDAAGVPLHSLSRQLQDFLEGTVLR